MNTDVFDATDEQILADQAKLIKEQEERIQDLESKLDLNRARIDTLMIREPYILDSDSNYMSTLTFCKKYSDYRSMKAAFRLDEIASLMCRDMNIRVSREPSARWGWIKLYPLQVLEECITIMDKD